MSGVRTMIRACSTVGIASAVLVGSYSCARAQDFETNETINRWIIESEKDPIFDTEDIFARLPSSNNLDALHFRCLEGELSTFVTWSDPLLRNPANNGEVIILFRFDTLQPQTEIWNPSLPDGMASFAPDALAFMRQAMMHKRIAIRKAGGGVHSTALFDLEGIDEAFTKVNKACNVPEDILGE